MRDLPKDAIEEILSAEEVGTLALTNGNKPYCIPMAFVYSRENNSIYFGFLEEGRKWNYIQTNNNVCFCVLKGMSSAVVEGKLSRVSDMKEFRFMLEASVKKHGGEPDLVRDRIEKKLKARVAAESDPTRAKTYKIEIAEMRGKG